MTPWHQAAGRIAAVVLLAFGLAACRPAVRDQDAAEFNHPAIRKARAKLNEGDPTGALEQLRKALDEHPGPAQAHLEAAQLYDHYLRDPLLAIYHYQRYLELRPDTEKRSMIEGFIQKNKIGFAAAVYEQTPGLDKRVQALQEEAERLRRTVRQLRANLAQTHQAPTGPAAAPGAGAPAPAAPAGARYVVQHGDTLSRIAATVYHNPRLWRRIYDANRDVLKTGDRLSAGQTLVIPPLIQEYRHEQHGFH